MANAKTYNPVRSWQPEVIALPFQVAYKKSDNTVSVNTKAVKVSRSSAGVYLVDTQDTLPILSAVVTAETGEVLEVRFNTATKQILVTASGVAADPAADTKFNVILFLKASSVW